MNTNRCYEETLHSFVIHLTTLHIQLSRPCTFSTFGLAQITHQANETNTILQHNEHNNAIIRYII